MSQPKPVIKYVLGFLFDESKAYPQVVLLRKLRPKWQAGRLNGVGGKVEPGESLEQAMVREFQEETGVDTRTLSWRAFCSLEGDGFSVHCFTVRSQVAWETARTVTDEEVEKHSADYPEAWNAISNLPWLIRMALDDSPGEPFRAVVFY